MRCAGASARADGDLFAAAGLWERWTDPASGEITTSFTLLTVNADAHPLMARMHRPGDEKRMPVLLAPGDFEAWLHATDEQAHALVRKTCAVPAGRRAGAPGAATARGATRPAGSSTRRHPEPVLIA